MLPVARVCIHFSFQHLLKSLREQLFQGVLGILCSNQLVLLNKACNCSFDQSPGCSPNLSITSTLLGGGVYTNYFTDSKMPLE